MSVALLAAVALPPAPADAAETSTAQARSVGQSTLRKSGGGNPRVVEIVSNALGETEFRFADEMAAAVASAQETGPNGEVALRVTPVTGPGGIHTVRDVLTLPNADFGIVSTRVLERLRETGEFGDITRRITYVAPLYMEEVHLLAGPKVRSLGDLEGQPVSIGRDESTTQVVAREILASAGVKVQEERHDLRGSIAALKAGEIAAAFIVSGKPIDGLKTLSPADGLHLVPLDVASPEPDYLPSAISGEDYPELLRPGESVDTLAVQNVLFAYDWPKRSARAQLGEGFIQSLIWRLSTLQKPPGHPKWQEVNLAGSLPGLRRYAGMEAYLKKAGLRGPEPASKIAGDAAPTRTIPLRPDVPPTTGSR
ncbi:TAXI family TRAP transporter solute-binding subunit [Salinarimonas soli]|uniref:TAXI family TRAP transporter solute-binding subunit n=1 Tax=Salinarimonas soli TaxID=1638099 RepID=UPI00166192A1|nr:TAXI family TRAP transporter solute-binding subunit [Salinarimonas soli]